MDYVLVIAAVVCAWASLRVIGGERERRVRDIVTTIASLPPVEPIEQSPVPASPGRGGQETSPANPAVRTKATR